MRNPSQMRFRPWHPKASRHREKHWPADDERFESEVLDAVNAERRRRHREPLELHPALTRAANSHAGDMAARDYFSHEATDGASPAERVSREVDCPPGAGVGENIAFGVFDDGRALVSFWMNSRGHRRNILRSEYRYMGVGHASDRFVQLFAMYLPWETIGKPAADDGARDQSTPASRSDPHDY